MTETEDNEYTRCYNTIWDLLGTTELPTCVVVGMLEIIKFELMQDNLTEDDEQD